MLSAVAVADVAEVTEDTVFDSTVDGLNGDPDSDSVRDNDTGGLFGPSPDDLDVNEFGVGDLNSQLGLPSSSQPLDFNADGTFTFDPSASPVIQALSEGEVEDFRFQYEFVGDTELGSEGTEEVTLRVTGVNDLFEVEFGGPEVEYVVNGNAVEFDVPLVQISDVDANDTYTVVLEVGQAKPTQTGPLGVLFLASEGDASGDQTLIITGTLDEVNAELLEVQFKPANIDYSADLDPLKLSQVIDITVTEFPGGDDANDSNSTTGSVTLDPALDDAGALIINQYPETENDATAFNENGFVDTRSGNLLSNDSDPDGDPISIAEVRFGNEPAVEADNTINGVDFTHELAGEFGTLFFNLDGSYVYAFDDEVEELGSGDQVQDVFEYDIIDSAWNVSKTPGLLTVNVTGTNDAPEFLEVPHDSTDGLNSFFANSSVPFSAVENLTEQTNAVPLTLDFVAQFDDVDVTDVHDAVVQAVFLEGDVPPGSFDGQVKTEGKFFDFLTVGDIVDLDGLTHDIELNFTAQAADLNYLDGGDTLTLVYQITVNDDHGASDTSYVKIKIDGTEDKPFIWIDDSGEVVEADPGDETTTTGGLLVSGIDQNDVLSFADNGVIHGAFGTLAIVVDAGGVESWLYTLDNNSPVVQALNEGEIVQDVFELAIFDQNGDPLPKLDDAGQPVLDDNGELVLHTKEIAIEITGTDDAPITTYTEAKVTEGDIGVPTFGEGQIAISDIDSDDNPTFVTNPLQPGSGTGVGEFGSIVEVRSVPNPDFFEGSGLPEFLEIYVYELDQEAVQQLARDEVLIDTVTLQAFDFSQVDEHGDVIVRESVTHDVTIQIKGTNDGPEITSDAIEIWEVADSSGVGLTAEGTLDVSDIDLLDEVVVALTGVNTVLLQEDGSEVPDFRDIGAYQSIAVTDGEGNSNLDTIEALLATLTLPTDPVVISGEDTGVASWTFDSGDEAFDFLAWGERLEITFDVVATDSYGETAESTITISILGKNDKPEIFVDPLHDLAEVTFKENFGSLEGNGYSASGTLSVSDLDASDFVTAASQAGQGVIGVEVDSTFPIPPDTGLTNSDFLSYLSLLNATSVVGVSETSGILEWSFDTYGEDFNFLAKGETLTLTYTVQVTDHHDPDSVHSEEIVITIEGTNDSPTVKGSIPNELRFDYVGSASNAIDADDFNNNGTLVSDLIGSVQEDLDVNGSLQGIAVQGFDFNLTTTGNEVWEFSLDDGATWVAFDADTSETNATVLDPSARVRLVPDSGGDNTGWAKLKFVLWDQTDGNPSGTSGIDTTERLTFGDDDVPHGEAATGDEMLYFTVQVNAPAADGPTAVADNFEVTAGSVTTLGSLLANDIDPDTLNGDLTASVIGDPAGVTVFTDGTFTFDSTGLLPGQSFSFQYLVSDGTSSDIGTATIFVTEAAVTIDGPEDVLVGKGENIFTAAPNGLGDLTVQTWTVDGVAVASGSSFTFDPDGPGTFVLTYTATDSSGAIASGSVTVTAVSAAIVDGDLVIGGTDGNDSITVNVVGSDYQVNVNGDISTFAIADVTGDIIICGHDGDDDIRVAPGVTQSTQIFAGSGDDTVFGGGGRDVVEAGLGNDTVVGRGGNDRLLGEDGDDTLEGNAGDDVIVTGDGTDTAVGGLGNDNLLGGGGVDTLEGNAGNDELFGGDGDDDLSGGTGDDVVLGQQGNDIVDGDAGNDMLVGGAGDDTINGGAGDDEISGQSGDDTIFGMSGVDIIDGGSGNDTIVAGAGNDIVNGGLGDDVIRGNGGSDLIFGDGGDDDLIGGNQDDQIFGGTGNDVLYGNSGDDTLDGGGGDDTLIGVQGDDTLTGGAGIDVLNGGFGIDTSIDVGETEILIEL